MGKTLIFCVALLVCLAMAQSFGVLGDQMSFAMSVFSDRPTMEDARANSAAFSRKAVVAQRRVLGD